MTLALVVVVLLAVALLPSALNIPQSNPNTVPEYAPVPPDEESQSEESGNLAALGQAGGSTLARTGGVQAIPPIAPTTRKTGGKRCVGNPPRQTEDPMAPPCVAFFEGNNGGSTYQGVTAEEITVVVYYDSNALYDVGNGEQPEQSPPPGTYCDIDKAPNTGGQGCYVADTNRDHTYIRFVRSYSRYFNDRYQIYGRRVHFWVFWNTPPFSEASKRSDAAANWARLKPFAALNQTIFSLYRDAYTEAMSRRGVLFFGGGAGLRAADPYPASYFQGFAPKVWSFAPDIEHWVDGHAAYVCTKMPPGTTVSHSEGGIGTDGRPFEGRPRKYGFISTSDPGYPGVRLFAQRVADALKSKCGIDPGPDERATYSLHGAVCCTTQQQTEATQNAAKLKRADVTTLLWLGGWEPFTSQGAEEVKWYPEVVYAGDGSAERNTWGRLQTQNFMRNAWVVSNQLRWLSNEESIPMQVCREGDQTLTRANCDIGSAFFREYYMLFKAIQAAGPRLTPATVDRGMHAIPRISSTNPDLASCFFDPGDYTCVKDATEMWWDGAGRSPGHNSPGCWRLVQAGRRYLPEQWTTKDEVFNPANAPCNAFQGGGTFDAF